MIKILPPGARCEDIDKVIDKLNEVIGRVNDLATVVDEMLEAREQTQWFAKGGDIVRSGPHNSAEAAAQAMTLHDGYKPDNFAIWPEKIR